jgi:copper(I)-binding protein
MPKLLGRMMLLTCLLPALGWAEYLQFSNQWIRAVPPNSKMTAAYAEITNSSEFDIWITGASSDQFGAIELHETIERDGMARMVHRDFVKLSPGETVQFKRGGKHFMMFSPKSAITEGDTYTINVILGNGDIESFSATVSRNPPQP